MTEIPALLIDDEEDARDLFLRLANRASRQLLEKHNVLLSLQTEIAVDYREGLDKVSSGTYPIVVIDLALPDPKAGARHDVLGFPGLQLVLAARKANKDVLAIIYTAYPGEAAEFMSPGLADALLPKDSTSASHEKLAGKISDLMLSASGRFNRRIDPNAGLAHRHAFGETISKDKERQWETCLRRLMRRAEKRVKYEPMQRGRSGAGVVAAYADDFLPVVLKWDAYDRLQDEVRRYDEYVSCFIPFRAITSQEGLAQAGDVAILAYSLVGAAHGPTPLGRAILRVKPDALAEAIEAYFETNCKRWFATSGADGPYDLALRCCERLFPKPEARRESYDHPTVQDTMQRAAKRLCATKDVVVSTLENLIARLKDLSVHCKPETIVHGDLNAQNLIWDDGTLWMIDFAKTGVGPRVFDFAKLEASLKKDVDAPAEWKSLSLDERVEAALQIEEILVSEFRVEDSRFPGGLNDFLSRTAKAIRVIRECALEECGPDAAFEYFVVLFLHTVKHLEYLVRDAKAGREVEVPLMRALFSAYRLAKWLEQESDGR